MCRIRCTEFFFSITRIVFFRNEIVFLVELKKNSTKKTVGGEIFFLNPNCGIPPKRYIPFHLITHTHTTNSPPFLPNPPKIPLLMTYHYNTKLCFSFPWNYCKIWGNNTRYGEISHTYPILQCFTDSVIREFFTSPFKVLGNFFPTSPSSGESCSPICSNHHHKENSLLPSLRFATIFGLILKPIMLASIFLLQIAHYCCIIVSLRELWSFLFSVN